MSSVLLEAWHKAKWANSGLFVLRLPVPALRHRLQSSPLLPITLFHYSIPSVPTSSNLQEYMWDYKNCAIKFCIKNCSSSCTIWFFTLPSLRLVGCNKNHVLSTLGQETFMIIASSLCRQPSHSGAVCMWTGAFNSSWLLENDHCATLLLPVRLSTLSCQLDWTIEHFDMHDFICLVVRSAGAASDSFYFFYQMAEKIDIL